MNRRRADDMSEESSLDCRRAFQLGSTLRQVKLWKVSSPILILLITVLSSVGGHLLIARAESPVPCSESICNVRAGYVANGDPDTYNFVESTFTLPESEDILIPSGTTSTKFSIGVGLGGDDHFNSPNWLAAQVDIQVTNGQINLTPTWSLADGATKAGQGSGGGFVVSWNE
jgi:peptidase A4-like protein